MRERTCPEKLYVLPEVPYARAASTLKERDGKALQQGGEPAPNSCERARESEIGSSCQVLPADDDEPVVRVLEPHVKA